MEPTIQYNQICFNFNWTWIKDKQIHHRGNAKGGMLMIADIDGNVIKMYGYELIM
jgi:hypothetical protein